MHCGRFFPLSCIRYSKLNTADSKERINRIEQIIDKYYKGSVKKSDLEDYTYKGLVAGLGDVYSTYYSESDFKELEESTSGVYYGVGIYMTQDTRQVLSQ